MKPRTVKSAFMIIDVCIVTALLAVILTASVQGGEPIAPYAANPAYWQYKSKPVLLLGASDNDNLFQNANVAEQLDALVSAGGNYIRNTMSSRDSGDVWPFYQRPDGKYDLEQWNAAYWEKFSTLLRLAYERDVIVQIEVWDRFDYSRDPWKLNPFNPVNNINYSSEESGLASDYPEHPATDLQPFFHSIPNMPRYRPKLELVRKYQERFVDKLLSYSLVYNNILYCMNNETSTPVAWGQYWIGYIDEKASARNKKVYATDMFDCMFRPQSCTELQDLLDRPDIYSFLDFSQINSRNFNQAHWDSLQWLLARRNEGVLRPVNNTKVYGGPANRDIFGSGQDGVEKFCRDIVAGCASARFHRPPSGIGLDESAQKVIRAIRKIETRMQFWELTPQMHLLANRENDEAYLTAQPGTKYLIYFPTGGDILLDLRLYSKSFRLDWIDLHSGEWREGKIIAGGAWAAIQTPGKTGWFVVID